MPFADRRLWFFQCEVSESNKVVARRVVEAFGRFPKITTMWDAGNRSSVNIEAVVDSP
jgi:hypothetical protein